jgi:hypothetical protein
MILPSPSSMKFLKPLIFLMTHQMKILPDVCYKSFCSQLATVLNRSHRRVGATLDFLLSLKANKEMFEQKS